MVGAPGLPDNAVEAQQQLQQMVGCQFWGLIKWFELMSSLNYQKEQNCIDLLQYWK